MKEKLKLLSLFTLSNRGNYINAFEVYSDESPASRFNNQDS